jgi:hypothetical protein
MNKELERVTLLLSKEYPDVDPVVIYKVIRFGWDEVYKSVEGIDNISVEFPKYGQWVIDYKILSGLVVKHHDTLAYKQEMFSEKNYERRVNKYLTLKHILEIVDKKVTNGYKVSHKKSKPYTGGGKKLIDKEGGCGEDSKGEVNSV